VKKENGYNGGIACLRLHPQTTKEEIVIVEVDKNMKKENGYDGGIVCLRLHRQTTKEEVVIIIENVIVTATIVKVAVTVTVGVTVGVVVLKIMSQAEVGIPRVNNNGKEVGKPLPQGHHHQHREVHVRNHVLFHDLLVKSFRFQ